MKGDSFGKVTSLSKLGMMTSQIQQKKFKLYTAKPIAHAVKKHLKMLNRSEQVTENEDSATLVKPGNCKDEYNRKIGQTG